mmetsp:Transcript_28113/g.94704  ORF Transcript_28113/g.94704 Transcript_28113/m.94704 type:complete len:264 (-) Transcript_28113:513-1304(-)
MLSLPRSRPPSSPVSASAASSSSSSSSSSSPSAKSGSLSSISPRTTSAKRLVNASRASSPRALPLNSSVASAASGASAAARAVAPRSAISLDASNSVARRSGGDARSAAARRRAPPLPNSFSSAPRYSSVAAVEATSGRQLAARVSSLPETSSFVSGDALSTTAPETSAKPASVSEQSRRLSEASCGHFRIAAARSAAPFTPKRLSARSRVTRCVRCAAMDSAMTSEPARVVRVPENRKSRISGEDATMRATPSAPPSADMLL